LPFVVVEFALGGTGGGSTGRVAAILLRQPFASVHASMLACGGKRQLQPTRVAARAPMRSVLMPIPLQEPEFRSHFLRRSNNLR